MVVNLLFPILQIKARSDLIECVTLKISDEKYVFPVRISILG